MSHGLKDFYIVITFLCYYYIHLHVQPNHSSFLSVHYFPLECDKSFQVLSKLAFFRCASLYN